jgi:hypothetical protein
LRPAVRENRLGPGKLERFAKAMEFVLLLVMADTGRGQTEDRVNSSENFALRDLGRSETSIVENYGHFRYRAPCGLGAIKNLNEERVPVRDN